MLTQTMPAVVKALQKTLSPSDLKAFTQALGNCNQPLTHRGPVNVSPATINSRSYEYPGTSIGDTWNTSNFFGGDNYFGDTINNYAGDNNFIDLGDLNNIFNDFRQYHNIFNEFLGPDIDVPGIGGGNTENIINNNLYNSNFFFPTNNNFFTQNFDNRITNVNNQTTYNNNNITNNQITRNSTINNITVNNINGKPVAGPAGPPGTPGRDGRDGAPGAPGAIIPVPFPIPDFGPPQAPPPNFGRKKITYIKGLPEYEAKLPEITLEIPVKKYSFDPATCSLTESEENVEVSIPEQYIPVEQLGEADFDITEVLTPGQ